MVGGSFPPLSLPLALPRSLQATEGPVRVKIKVKVGDCKFIENDPFIPFPPSLPPSLPPYLPEISYSSGVQRVASRSKIMALGRIEGGRVWGRREGGREGGRSMTVCSCG